MEAPFKRLYGTVKEQLAAMEVQSPREIDARLTDLGYRGQAKARRAASVLAYRHVRRNYRLHVEGIAPETGVRENVLFLGPTGSGKTYLVELLFREILDLPTIIVDATQFSETGYVGEDVNMILSHLFEAADGDMAWASCGVVCMDEFDKLATARSDSRFAGQQTTKDVSGFGVQRSLLHVLSASKVDFPPDFGFTSRTPPLSMPMAGLTFIGCGAFSGFRTTAERMRRSGGMGFGQDPKKLEEEAIAARIDEDQLEYTAAFSRYGFIPELIGRFSRFVSFEPLDPATLRSILQDNVAQGYLREFRHEGVQLEIAPEVYEHVVDKAVKRETGARGLRAALAPKLEEAAYLAFGDPRIKKAILALKDGEIAVETAA